MDGLELKDAKNARPTVLLLGASGFLGRNLLRKAAGSIYHWIPASRRSPDGENHLHFENWKKIASDLIDTSPTVSIVNCAALSDLPSCERDPLNAWQVNVELPEEMACFCKERGIPLIHISSDGLFPNATEGPRPRYWKKNSPAAPVSAYGRTKLEAEARLQKQGWGDCVRLSFLGPGLGTSRGLITFLAQSLVARAEPIPGFEDVWFTPLHVEHVFDQLEALISRKPRAGFELHHWASFPAVTKASFIEQVLSRAGLSAKIRKTSRASMQGPTAPLDQSLESDCKITLEDVLVRSANSLQEELKALAAER